MAMVASLGLSGVWEVADSVGQVHPTFSGNRMSSVAGKPTPPTGTGTWSASGNQRRAPTNIQNLIGYHFVRDHLPRKRWRHHHELEFGPTRVTELHVHFLVGLRRDGVH